MATRRKKAAAVSTEGMMTATEFLDVRMKSIRFLTYLWEEHVLGMPKRVSAELTGGKKVSKEKYDLIKRVGDALIEHKEGLGCKKEAVTKLMGILVDNNQELFTGRVFGKADYKTAFISDSIVIPISSPNGHDYPLNQPVLIALNGYNNVGYSVAATSMGNHLPDLCKAPDRNRRTFRPAEEKDFDAVRKMLEQWSINKFSIATSGAYVESE